MDILDRMSFAVAPSVTGTHPFPHYLHLCGRIRLLPCATNSNLELTTFEDIISIILISGCVQIWGMVNWLFKLSIHKHFKSQFHYFLAVCPWTTSLPSLYLSFTLCIKWQHVDSIRTVAGTQYVLSAGCHLFCVLKYTKDLLHSLSLKSLPQP